MWKPRGPRGLRAAGLCACRFERASAGRSPRRRETRTGRAGALPAPRACETPSFACASSRFEAARRKPGRPYWMASYATKCSSLNVVGFRVLRPVAADSPAFKRSARTSRAIAFALRMASAFVAPYARAPTGSMAAIQRPSTSFSVSTDSFTARVCHHLAVVGRRRRLSTAEPFSSESRTRPGGTSPTSIAVIASREIASSAASRWPRRNDVGGGAAVGASGGAGGSRG